MVPDIQALVEKGLIKQPGEINFARINSELAINSVVADESTKNEILAQARSRLEGMGILQNLFKPGVTDILINGPAEIWVDGGAGLARVPERFESVAELQAFVVRLAASAGSRIDTSQPRVDCLLPDGCRLSAIFAPLTSNGPVVAIRVPIKRLLNLENWQQDGETTYDLFQVVFKKLNVVVTGATGSGKTTFLKSLLAAIPETERVVTIEDQSELAAVAAHQISLQTRMPNLEGFGEVTLSDLLRQSLRLRPDRIVVGELRGAEVLVWLQAINTGHAGSLTTLHANSAASALDRLQLLCQLNGLDKEISGGLITQSVDLVIHVIRTQVGRKVGEIIGVSARGKKWLQQT
jgi:pilus assembly protein CpaF